MTESLCRKLRRDIHKASGDRRIAEFVTCSVEVEPEYYPIVLAHDMLSHVYWSYVSVQTHLRMHALLVRPTDRRWFPKDRNGEQFPRQEYAEAMKAYVNGEG